MLRTEKLDVFSSVNINACLSSSVKTRWRPRQKGSILIGIIITMVIMATLAGGMVYLTTTSTFQELFANNHARAYYAAESGGMYASALARQALANGTFDTLHMNTTTPDNILTEYTLANNEKFQITNWTPLVNAYGSMTVTFHSIGTVGSGFLQAKRKLTYYINPSSQGGGGSGGGNNDPPPVDLATLAGRDPQLTGSMEFALANPGGDQALMVSKDQGSGINAEAYVFVPPGTPNPFWVNWGASGGYSSYDLQVKIATGTLDGTTLEDPPTTYANGLTFRSVALSGQRQDFLGVSLVRNTQLVPNTAVTPPSVFTPWTKATLYLKDVYVIYNGAYYQSKENHTSSSRFSTDSLKWRLLSNADTPMIVLWRRDSNHANGDGTWLAYKILDEKSFIVDASGHTIDWSTLLVRVIEAASVKLGVASAPLINIGDTIAGATGTAKVFRKINETSANGGNVVLLLNNIGGTFTRPTNIAGYNTDATWGYRSRDNYIWVFYTDQNTVTPVRSSTDTTPMETPDANSIRLGQLRSTTACGPINCPINWPITYVEAWTAADDRFSLVNWNSNVNTTLLSEYSASYTIPSSATATIRIMGSGKEAEAIIRTDLYTRPGPYAVTTDFPGEIGLVSLGGVNDAFFDDLAYRLTGGSGSGGYFDGTGLFVQGP